MAKRNYSQIKTTGQIISPVDLKTQPASVRNMVLGRRTWISRNSKCPCNSGQRFKRCCMW